MLNNTATQSHTQVGFISGSLVQVAALGYPLSNAILPYNSAPLPFLIRL